MSLIIDANCAAETLSPQPSQDFAPVCYVRRNLRVGSA